MRAVVLAVKGDKAAVAGKNGRLQYIKNNNYLVGQVLEVKNTSYDHFMLTDFSSKVRPLNRWGIVVAAAVCIVVFSGGIAANAMPLSTVTIDVNPSIALDLNLFYNVVGARALNEDAREIVSNITDEILGENIEDAIKITLSELSKNNYISGEETLVAGTVSSKGPLKSGRYQKLTDKISQASDEWNDENASENVILESTELTEELIKEAQEKSITPGILQLKKMEEKYKDKLHDKPDEAGDSIMPPSQNDSEDSITESQIEGSDTQNQPPQDNSNPPDGQQPPKGNDDNSEPPAPPQDNEQRQGNDNNSEPPAPSQDNGQPQNNGDNNGDNNEPSAPPQDNGQPQNNGDNNEPSAPPHDGQNGTSVQQSPHEDSNSNQPLAPSQDNVEPQDNDDNSQPPAPPQDNGQPQDNDDNRQSPAPPQDNVQPQDNGDNNQPPTPPHDDRQPQDHGDNNQPPTPPQDNGGRD
jgi:hypothetical protein